MSNERPQHVDGLDVHEVEDGLVVYDAVSDRVHYLNTSATLVFSLCDGSRTTADIDRLVREAWPHDTPDVDLVPECVERLRGEGVLR
jgi:hypothetical protein